VVEKDTIDVRCSNGKNTLVYTMEIQNLNFETLPLNLDKGKYRFEIFVD